MSKNITISSTPAFSSIQEAPDGVFALDTRGLITQWDAGMQEVSGFADTEVLGRVCTALQCPECSILACPFAMPDFDHAPATPVEACLRHADGRIINVLKWGEHIVDEADVVTGTLVSLKRIPTPDTP